MSSLPCRQRGLIVLAILMALFLGTLAYALGHAGQTSSFYGRDRITADALAQAKAALIGYAAGGTIDIAGTLGNAARPGDLPCPDLNDDGIGEPGGCGNGSGSTGQNLRLGRLPWKDLGLPDLRDSSGERLWYAVSTNFKRRTRYGGILNSDTPGTITIRDASGRIILTGSGAAANGAVAVIIAPGVPLLRPTSLLDATPYAQTRGNTATSQAIDYLDLGNGEDNAAFIDGSATDGFIAGPVVDGSGKVAVNDRLAWITTEELAPYLERRVAAEVAQCLQAYGAASGGRYPWPAAASLGTGGSVGYGDTANRRFGRLPDTPFTNTRSSAPDMNDDWTGNCNINSNSGWWPNWKELVFYGIADNHKPMPSAPANRCGVAGFSGTSCIGLDGSRDRQYAVIASGRRLPGSNQLRSNNSQKNAVANYLEGANRSDDDIFATVRHNAGSNDIVRANP